MSAIEHVVIHQPGEGRRIDMGSFHMTVKAEHGDTAARLSVLEADEPPGFGPPMHIHRDAGEAFYVLSGEYVIFVDDAEHVCGAGSFIYIPAGVNHGFRVGPAPSRKLVIFVPAAMVSYFDELAAANARAATLDPVSLDSATLGDLAQRYGMQVTGPVPEGYV